MNRKISVEQVISDSFSLWKQGMKYNILFSLLYFGLLIAFNSVILLHTGILEKITKLSPLLSKNPDVFMQRMMALTQTTEFANYALMMATCSSLVYPLHIGLMNIFRKMENKEEVSFGDLLEGYNGMNFFKYASYYMCWLMIYNFLESTFILLGLLWIMLTLMIVPIMYFKSIALGEAFLLSFQVLKNNFILVLVCVLVAAIFGYSGILLFGFGRILTFPFWCAIVYTLYKNILSTEIKTENQL